MSELTKLKIKQLRFNTSIHDRYSVLGYSLVFFVVGVFCFTIGMLASTSPESIADILGGLSFMVVGYRYLRRFLKTSA